jgi:DNA-binding transcriptional LysR family regulator
MLIMNSDDVRTFVAVVEAGSISGAARELYLSQPAVSRRVQRLEQAIGVPLIDRRKRPFALTDVGRAAVERCRRLLSATDELKGLAEGGVLPTQELRMGVAHALTEFALAEPVDAMRREFPAVAVRLHTGWSRDLLARVRSGALGASVILLPERDAEPGGVSARKLASEHLAVVAPRNWPSRTYPVRELDGTGWILNPEGCAARAELERQLARARLPLRVSVETYNYELQLRLIARGRGLGLVPNRLFLRSPTRKKLRKLSVRGLSFPLTIWLVAGELSPGLEPALRALERALTDRLSKTSFDRRSRS